MSQESLKVSNLLQTQSKAALERTGHRSERIPAWLLTPVRHGMETRGERVLRVVALLFLTDGRVVEHLHTVAVVKELAAGFLASACVQKGLGALGPVWAPVHQHLSRDHHDDSDKNCVESAGTKLCLTRRKVILRRAGQKCTEAHRGKKLHPICDHVSM